jgi:flagellar biogenesis protein FliO
MDIVRQSLAITFVLALLWAALWLLRKKGAIQISPRKGRGRTGVLEARARLALTPQHSIHLVRIGQRDLVLALHPSGVKLLAELPVTPGSEP